MVFHQQGHGYYNNHTDTYYYSVDDDYSAITEATYVHLGVYLAYFVGLLFLALMVDRCQVMNKLVNHLGDTSHQWFVQYKGDHQRSNSTANFGDDDSSLIGPCGCFCGQAVVAQSAKVTATTASTPTDIRIGSSVLYQFFCGPTIPLKYCSSFRKRLLTGAAYWGCASHSFCCFSGSGFLSDMMFYFCNNHIILSMFSASLQHPLSRAERRVAFLVQHSVAFFLSVLLSMISFVFTEEQLLLINLFVVTPFTLFVNYSYYYMLACPCLIREYRWNICKCCASCLECMGKVIAYPLSLGSIILLLMAAMFTQNDSYTALARYAYQVHLVSTFTDFLMTAVRFLHDHYFKFKVLGFTVFEVGNWFKEMVEIFDLEKDTGYTETTKTLIPLLLTMVQWTRVPGVVRPLPVEGDIEMQSVPHADGASLPTVASPSAEGGLSPVTAVAAVDPVVATPHSILEDQRALEMLAKPWPTAQTASERTPAIESNVDDLYNKIYGGAAAAAAPSAE